MGSGQSKEKDFEDMSNEADNDQVIDIKEEEQDTPSDPIGRIIYNLRKPVPNVEEIQSLLQSEDGTTKVDLNTPDLPYAIPENADPNDPTIKKMIERNSKRTFLGDYPMHFLVGRPSSENTPELIALVKLFFLKDHQINCRNKLGSTPLHRACAAGNVEMVEELIRWGAPIDAVNDMQLTCLHMACYAGHTEVVRVLLANGASKHIHFKCAYGVAPADYVLKDDILQLLKEAKKAQGRTEEKPQTTTSTTTTAEPESEPVQDPEATPAVEAH